MFGGNFAPRGWALCEGQLLPISQYEALFALLGTTYGGDGQTTFGLPDLRGRVPVHPNDSTIRAGGKGGSETVTVTTSQLPSHTHTVNVMSSDADLEAPTNATWASSNLAYYSNGTSGAPVPMNPQAVSSVGGNQSHNNMMPSGTISFIISLYGVYPSHS